MWVSTYLDGQSGVSLLPPKNPRKKERKKFKSTVKYDKLPLSQKLFLLLVLFKIKVHF